MVKKCVIIYTLTLLDALPIYPNTVASLIERMELAGFVRREPDVKDRRAHRLHLTPVGRRKYEKAREEALAMQMEIEEHTAELQSLKHLVCRHMLDKVNNCDTF